MVCFPSTVSTREEGTTFGVRRSCLPCWARKVLYQDMRDLLKTRRSYIIVTTSRGAVFTITLYTSQMIARGLWTEATTL